MKGRIESTRGRDDTVMRDEERKKDMKEGKKEANKCMKGETKSRER